MQDWLVGWDPGGGSRGFIDPPVSGSVTTADVRRAVRQVTVVIERSYCWMTSRQFSAPESNACGVLQRSAVDIDSCLSFLQKRGVCIDGVLSQGKSRPTVIMEH